MAQTAYLLAKLAHRTRKLDLQTIGTDLPARAGDLLTPTQAARCPRRTSGRVPRRRRGGDACGGGGRVTPAYEWSWRRYVARR